MTTVSETLHKAADLIEQRGWTQGQWGSLDETSPLCLEGAILAASGVLEFEAVDYCPAGRAVREYLGLTDDKDGARLYNWNDQTGVFCRDYWGNGPHRTASEVIEVLRAAAVIEAAKEAAPAEVPA